MLAISPFRLRLPIGMTAACTLRRHASDTIMWRAYPDHGENSEPGKRIKESLTSIPELENSQSPFTIAVHSCAH